MTKSALSSKIIHIAKSCSAYNDRTRCYKNHKFDIVLDQESSQGKTFADCGVPNLIKQVVQVSLKGLMFKGLQLDDLRLRTNRLR